MLQSIEHMGPRPLRGFTHPSPIGLLDLTEVAAILCVSMPTLRKLRRQSHRFPRPFKVGKRRCIRLQDLEAWAAREAQAANGDESQT